jgi:hypothetical protein
VASHKARLPDHFGVSARGRGRSDGSVVDGSVVYVPRLNDVSERVRLLPFSFTVIVSVDAPAGWCGWS